MTSRLWRRVAGATATAGLLIWGLLVFRSRENAGHTPNYGDLPTWLTFAAAAVGIPFAAYSFVLQRRQLTEQQRTIAEEFARQKKRDELLDVQLEQTRAAGRAMVRAQAEMIDLVFDTWETETDQVDGYGDPVPGDLLHLARVTNKSSRPIWEVRCRLQKTSSSPDVPAVSVGRYQADPIGRYWMPPTSGESAALIRPGGEHGFVFDAKISETASARMYVTFTDDAGNRWKIDHDLHLVQSDGVPGGRPVATAGREGI